MFLLGLLCFASIIATIYIVKTSDSSRPAEQEPTRPGPAKVMRLSMTDALERLRNGEKAILLDVRTPEEHAAFALSGSLLVPVAEPARFIPAVESVIQDKNAPVFVYCRSGRRSQNAAEMMVDAGYTRVYNIGGVIDLPDDFKK